MGVKVLDNGNVEFYGTSNDVLLGMNKGQTRLIEQLVDAYNDYFKRMSVKQMIDDYISTQFKEVIFHGPATIVLWQDGTKTVVKCTEGDTINYEMGVAMATLKKVFGDAGYGRYKKRMKEWIPEKETDPNEEQAKAFIAAVKAFNKGLEEAQHE